VTAGDTQRPLNLQITIRHPGDAAEKTKFLTGKHEKMKKAFSIQNIPVFSHFMFSSVSCLPVKIQKQNNKKSFDKLRMTESS